jgi:membrane protease YdiL (CAAX protease family)
VKKITYLFVILGILISELIFEWNQTYGFVIYSVLLGVVLISMEKDVVFDKSEVLLIFLMIVPIARITELFFPFGGLWGILAFYCVIAFLGVYYAWKFDIKSGEVELKDLSYTVAALVIGVFGMAAGEFIFHMEHSIIIPLICFIVYAEELLFRGEIQNLTREKYKWVYAVFFTSLLYGIFSISYGFPIFLFAFAASLILCLVYNFTKNIYITFLINAAFHAALFMFYPVFTTVA